MANHLDLFTTIDTLLTGSIFELLNCIIVNFANVFPIKYVCQLKWQMYTFSNWIGLTSKS